MQQKSKHVYRLLLYAEVLVVSRHITSMNIKKHAPPFCFFLHPGLKVSSI